MNKMKSLAVACILGGLMLAGCAKDQPLQGSQVAPPDPRGQVAAMVASCAESIKDIVGAAGGDAASKVAGVGAIERLCGSGGQQLAIAAQQQAAPQPQSLGAALWQSALQVADIALRGYGIKANRDVAVIQSNNAANTTIASYSAFSSMGNAIASAGTAGYAFIQAPGAVTTTTNTISGSGVIGSGTYTGPVTTTTSTTRTCTGAAGGNGGGTTTGAAGGAGGTATC